MTRLHRPPLGAPDSDPDRLKRYADALERLIEADVGSRPSLADRIEEILEIGLSHLGMDLAEVGRLGAGGFSGWHAAGKTASRPEHAARRADAARAALSANAPTASSPNAEEPSFLAAPLADVAPDAAVVLIGPPAPAGLDPSAIRFLQLLAQVLSGAMVRHRGRQDLADERDELSMILENVPAFVVSVDSSGRIVTLNHTARRLRRPPESAALDGDALRRAEPRFAALESWDEEEATSHLWMRTDRIPYAAPGGSGSRLLVVATDVTELVEKEKQLAKANAGLNQFAYIASHDLQEPLRKIGTFTDLLLRGLDRGDREDVEYGARVIKESARRASTLINDLLSWSRLSNRPLDRQTIDLPALVRETLSDMLAARPGVTVAVTDAMQEGTVRADPARLRQLLENLISNALKYRHADRPLAVTLTLRRKPTGGYVFEIADNGIGFDPAYANTIFEPFRRLHGDRQYAGTGVGLAICALVADRHGWTLSAEGRPGEGAVFRVTMPARTIA